MVKIIPTLNNKFEIISFGYIYISISAKISLGFKTKF